MPFASPTKPPALQPPTISLVRSSLPVEDDTEGRWVNGYSFQPLPAYQGWTDDPCAAGGSRANDTTNGNPGNTPPGPGTRIWTPPVHRTWDRCSSFGYRVHDYKERATNAMEIATYGLVETEFWTGAQAQRSGWGTSGGGSGGGTDNSGNLWLASAHATVISGGTTPSIIRAIEIAEQAIASCGSGGRGMIHCTVGAQPQLPNVRREGDLLLTARDTIVVAGVGYPGTGPDGSTPPGGQTWIYATGLTQIRVDDIKLFPDPEDYISRDPQTSEIVAEADDRFIAAAMNRDTNDVIVRAERFAQASWDGQCHFAILAALNT